MQAAGIAEELRADVRPRRKPTRRAAALALARKRRFGPFGVHAALAGEEAHRHARKAACGEWSARAMISTTPAGCSTQPHREELVQWVAEAREDSRS